MPEEPKVDPAGPVTWETDFGPERDPVREREIMPDVLVDEPTESERAFADKSDN
mgnify:CR=1 FL=1